MRPALPIILAALAAAGAGAAAAAAAEGESIARFANDDHLAGSLASLTSDTLLWNSPALEKPAAFLLKKVVDLSLPAELPEISADHEAVVTLTNGDTVRGQLSSVTDEAVSLDTWFAGRMTFNRLMVSGVRIEGKSSMLYRGPSGLDGWTQSPDPPAWSYGRAAFRSKAAGSIARDGVLPDECSVTFDVAWRSDSIALKVVLFSNEADSGNPDSGYELSFQRTSVYLRNGKTHSFLGSSHSQVLSESDKAKVEIRASRTSGKVCLFINDSLIEVWTDPDVGRGRFGSCLHFISQNALPMRISGIGVAAWDGVIDQLPEPRVGLIRRFGFQGGAVEEPKPEPPEKPGETRMELANGDSLDGEVTSIQDGVISMKTPLGDIRIPVGRLRSVALKQVDLERCIRRNGDIRATFPDGTSLVFRLDEVGDGTITGSSQNFGTATFRMSAFCRIEFNIYDVELEDKRMDEDW